MKLNRFFVLGLFAHSFFVLTACGPSEKNIEAEGGGAGATANLLAQDKCSEWVDTSNNNRVSYCVKEVLNQPNGLRKTLYVFHGMGGNAKSVCDSVTSDLSLISKNGISHVVCPSFGPHWVIHEKGRKDSFDRFQSYVQQKYGTNPSLKPVLYGLSMGGYNVIHLSHALDAKSLRFQKVVAACPALFPNIDDFLGSGYADTIVNWAPNLFFGSFDQQTSREIIKNSPNRWKTLRYFPEMLVMSNLDDDIGVPIQSLDIGIYRGAKEFYQRLRTSSIMKSPPQLKELPGKHCANLPTAEIIQFLGEGFEPME